MLMNLPKKVNIVEVGPRDGLQNESEIISAENKIELINKLSETGLKNIELTAFVHPKWTPQMADSNIVSEKTNKKKDIDYVALVPNEKGLTRAIESGIKSVAVFMSATESFNSKNLNRSREESLEIISDVIKLAKKNGINKIRAYLSTVFGCPFEGKTKINDITKITKKLIDLGVYQVSLSDTIGIGNPKLVSEVLQETFKVISDKKQLALHFHDTRGIGLANVVSGLEMGITTFDSSIGGLGGCPYAPGATGNIATEDLVNMLHSMGIETGTNLEKLVECNQFISKILKKDLPSKFTKTYLATKKLPL